jgi:hypothetical protein
VAYKNARKALTSINESTSSDWLLTTDKSYKKHSRFSTNVTTDDIGTNIESKTGKTEEAETISDDTYSDADGDGSECEEKMVIDMNIMGF